MKTRIQSLQKHHRFVSVMRKLLPILAGGLVLSLMIWPQIVKRRDFISDVLKSSSVPLNSNAKIDMKEVMFYSEDGKGQPFTLTADKIWELDTEKRIIQLDDPKGKMTLNSGVNVFSDSPVALFYQEKGLVYFEQEVHLDSDNGYQAKASNVNVDYQNQKAWSEKPIYLHGEKIDLDATGFYMRQNGNEVDFTGPTKTILKDAEKKQNIVITADGLMKARQKTQTIATDKNVVIVYEQNKIYCDKMIAHFKTVSKNTYDLASVQVQKNVKIITPNETITGDEAFYDIDKEKVFITGKVNIVKEEGNVTGDRAVVDMKTGLSRLETDKKSGKQRVKGTLYPTKIKK